MIAILPNFVRDAINEKLDAAFTEQSEAVIHRDIYFQKLLEFYDDNGYIPDFQITKTTQGQEG